MSDETTLLPCPWCGGYMRLHPINVPWTDGDPCWSIWHEDMGEAGKRKCPMEMGGYDTREEAIKAWNTRADYHGYEQAAIEAWESIKAWNIRTHGTLTAEQVRDAIERHVKFYEGGDYDEQAIADELNAELGSGTCENVNTDGYGFYFECSVCGYRTIVHNCAVRLDELPSYCPNCGAKAVKR